MRKKNRVARKVCSVIVCMAMMTGIVNGIKAGSMEVSAAENYKTLGLAQVKSLALANSSSYRQIKSKISLKEVGYKQAVKSLQLKKKNLTTFRWSPLLNFQFPQQLTLEQESEFALKPTQMQTEIKKLEHDLTDEVYAVYENVSNLFVTGYAYQQKIEYQQEQLDSQNKTLAKNEARLALGLANQKDVDAIQKSIDSLNTSLSENMRNLESTKRELGNLINLDISTGYLFGNPYVETDLPRSELQNLIDYTLEHDQSYYEAKLDTQLALLELNTNYKLMESQYKSDMGYISSYVQQIKNGDKVDSNAFKQNYDKFLEKIDAPWKGAYRIIFFSFPKEWFKGAIDGVRYVEDNPYVLYENALEYQTKVDEQNQLAASLEKQVRDSFEQQVSARNSYDTLQKQIASEKENLEKMQVLNSLGECTFEEYTEQQSQYEQLQMDALEALQTYTSLLYSYDRLTCGAVSEYLKGADISLSAAQGAESYIVDEEEGEEGAKYYITSLVEDNMFEFGIYVPEDFETDITHYELWGDNIQIGERTEINKKIRHLVLTLDTVDKVVVKLYNDDEFIAECEIDAQAYEGPLDLQGNYVVKEADKQKVIGSYSSKVNSDTSLLDVTLDFESSEGVEYYVLQNIQGKYLFSETPVEAKKSFQYLAFLEKGLGDLVIKCYDGDKTFLYDAHFNTEEYAIYVESQEGDDAQ